MGKDQIIVLPRMSFGTQAGDDIPCPKCPPRILSQDSGEALCLEVKPSVTPGKIVSQLRTQLQLTRNPVTA